MTRILKTAAMCAICAILAASCTPSHARAGKGKGAPVEKKETVKSSSVHGVKNIVDTAGTGSFAYGDIAVDEEKRFADSLRKVEFEQIDIEDTLVKRAADKLREGQPVTGGRATVYLQRRFLDDAAAEMIRMNPFEQDGSERKLFNVTDSTHRRLEFTLTHEIKRADGRRATALDFIELWSRLLKSRPAQGLAIFRNVQGAQGYVNGSEPLVGGFNAADEHTIRIRLAKPDPLAFQRLRTPAIIGGPFMLGPYYAAGPSDGTIKLLPNANSRSDTAYLTECTVQLGGDPDAMASFMQGKYAAMALYSAEDLETAKTELEGRASLVRLPSDRYFLANKSADEQLRKFVRGAVSGLDLLKNSVKAEGEEIFSVTAHTAELQKVHTAPPQLPKPIKVIYRSDDPVSTIIAEKLNADFNEAGLATEIIGGNAESYERTLVSGRYDCAVGWAPEAVLENLTEQLHFASIWFSDEMDSQIRLSECREIPLFSVNNYMLLQEDVRLYKDRISGIWSAAQR